MKIVFYVQKIFFYDFPTCAVLENTDIDFNTLTDILAHFRDAWSRINNERGCEATERDNDQSTDCAGHSGYRPFIHT